MNSPLLAASDLVKHYRERSFIPRKKLALNGFGISIQPGEAVALLGPNGAGKSTFLRVLFGLVLPSRGHIEVFGSSWDAPGWKTRTGYVPEFYTPAKFLKGTEILAMVGQANGISRPELRKRIDLLEQAIGLKEIISLRVRNLSRGMMQKLAIAQALIRNPEFLVMDEPSANLDAINRKKLRDLLQEMKSQGKTMLISSHILSEVEELCDRVVFIDKGAVVQQGAMKDLLAPEEGYYIAFKAGKELPSELLSLGQIRQARETGLMVLTTSGEESKNRAVKIMGQNDIEVVSLEKKHKSLEQCFMELLGEK